MLAALLALTGIAPATAQVRQKAPKATTVVSKAQTLAPGQSGGFALKCPRGYILTDFNIDAVTFPGQSERSDPKLGALRVTTQQIKIGGVSGFGITNVGDETLRVFIYARCVRETVRVKLADGPVDARLRDKRVPGGATPGAGPAQQSCGKGSTPIGVVLSQLPAFHPLSVLAYRVFTRRLLRGEFGQGVGGGGFFGPPGSGQEFAEEVAFALLCAEHRAALKKARAKKKSRSTNPVATSTAAKKPAARVIVHRIARKRTLPPNADPNEVTQISVRCPRRFTATSFAWNGRNPDVKRPTVHLRRSLYPDRRRVAVRVTNSTGSSHSVNLTAICLSIRVKSP